MMRRGVRVAGGLLSLTLAIGVSSCQYLRLARPSVISQLNPRVAALVNELPAVDRPNEALVAQLYAKGGLSHAEMGDDGVMRDKIRVPPLSFLWEPAIIVMEQGGELELEFQNEDQALHMALLPSNGDREIIYLPTRTGGRARIRLDEPGLYWFGCPVANHAGRGMLGFIFVYGDTPPEARLDRPKQPQP